MVLPLTIGSIDSGMSNKSEITYNANGFTPNTWKNVTTVLC